jgi:hypothetical protein
MSLKLLNIINETEDNCKYQVRDIGGSSVYYKKCGNNKWNFIDEKIFLNNSNKKNTIEWEKPKEKKSSIRQIEVSQKKGNKLEYLKTYYTNLSPNGYKINIEDDKIIITPE